MHYGIAIHNPNALAAANTVVRVALYDVQDAEIGTYESTVALVCPGETIGFAGQAGNGLAPARVEFTLDSASTTWKESETASNPFAIDICADVVDAHEIRDANEEFEAVEADYRDVTNFLASC